MIQVGIRDGYSNSIFVIAIIIIIIYYYYLLSRL